MDSYIFKSLAVNPLRFKADFDALAHIGASSQGEMDRPALSEAHLEARRWFAEQIRLDGLEFSTDGAGNHSARLKCGPDGAPWLMLGSHLDSVPRGGIYDGALGVLAALEVLRVVRDARLELPVNLEAIDLTDEEGTLIGLMGSAALAGRLRAEDLEKPRGGRERLLAGLQRAGLSETRILDARRDPKSLAGYLELHIEQGPRLVKSGVQIGVVTGIVGICSYNVSFHGQADHAGTTPLEDRQDASLGASSFTLAARRMVMQEFPSCSVNIGWIGTQPKAFNIVPARADLTLELRAPEPQMYLKLEETLIQLAEGAAQQYGLSVELEFLSRHQPTPLSPIARQAIELATYGLSLTTMPLFSGAGHDAQMFAPLCPSGMIFIPSTGGSHSPREHAEWSDCLNGANTLLQAALVLIDRLGQAEIS